MSIRTFAEPKSGRALLRLATSEFATIPKELGTVLGRFVLFVAADTARDAQEKLVDTAEELLRRGVVAVHCWGLGSHRLETCFDLAAARLYGDQDPVIMTSSSEDADLEGAIWDGVVATHPDDGLDDGYETVVLAIVGSQTVLERVDAYLEAGVPLRDEA